MGRYIGTSEVGTFLSMQTPLTGTAYALIDQIIPRIEAGIDAYTRRNFAGTPGTVYYNRYQQGRIVDQALYLDRDLHTLVGVINGEGQTIPVGSVWVEPRNTGAPYRMLRLKSSYVWVWNTDSDVTISGTFGFSTVAPYDIQQAAIRWTAYAFKQRDEGGPGAVAGFEQAGAPEIPQGMPSDVRWLLSPYRSRSGGMI